MVQTIKFSEFAAENLGDPTNTVVGVGGGVNVITPAVNAWTTATRPATPYLGLIGINATSQQYEYWNGLEWVALAAGGSGAVGAGAQNQLAFYPGVGVTNTVTGLLSGNNGLLVTDSFGAPSVSSTTPSGLTIPEPNIHGFTDGSVPAAGFIGEEVQNVINSTPSPIVLPNSTPTELTHISLSAGFWLVWGDVSFIRVTGIISTAYIAWISTSLALPTNNALRSELQLEFLSTTFGIKNYSLTLTPQIFNVSTTTTVYIAGYSAFSAGSISMCGGIYAVRIR